MSTLQWPPDSYGANEPLYEKTILDAVAGGAVDVVWAPVKASAAGHDGTFYVTALPIKIDGFYPGMGARVLQQVGDLLEATLAPPRLVDLAYEQSQVRITPFTSGSTQAMFNACNPGSGVKMQTIACMRVYAAGVEAELAAAGYSRGMLVGGFGKYFVLVRGLSASRGANYGWLEKGAGPPYAVTPAAQQPFPFHAIQDVGTAHGLNQNDYSQGGFLVYRYCEVDGKAADVYDVMQDATLSSLICHDGPLPYARQPGVDVYACATHGVVMGSPSNGAGCPPPTSPPTLGGASGWGTAAVVGGVLAGGGLAYATRKTWMPWLKRLVRL